jgi:hypothetical protein
MQPGNSDIDNDNTIVYCDTVAHGGTFPLLAPQLTQIQRSHFFLLANKNPRIIRAACETIRPKYAFLTASI